MTAATRLRGRFGPWAAVTGASDGIGRACAQQLAAAGLNLVLVARRQPLLDRLAAELSTAHGIRTRVLALDLTTDDAIAKVDTDTLDLDVGLLVAAAGFGTSGLFLDADPAAEADMLRVNCAATLGLAHRFARRFAARRETGGVRGGMVLMGSLVAFQGVPFAAHYAATKAYVQALAEALRLELRAQGITVVASAPGPVRSGFGTRAGMQITSGASPEAVARGTLATLVSGGGTATPGLLSKLLTWSLAPLPRGARSRIMGEVMRGMTQHRAPPPRLQRPDAA